MKVIDSVVDYAAYMEEIFDFPVLRKYIEDKDLKVLLTALNGGEIFLLIWNISLDFQFKPV